MNRHKVTKAVLLACEDIMQSKKPWTLEQLAERIADHLESFTEAITRRKDIGEMGRQTKQAYEIYRDYEWHTDTGVAKLLQTTDSVAGARRRELKNDYGFKFEDEQRGPGLWFHRLLQQESPVPAA